jgi:hypothetical protein
VGRRSELPRIAGAEMRCARLAILIALLTLTVRSMLTAEVIAALALAVGRVLSTELVALRAHAVAGVLPAVVTALRAGTIGRVLSTPFVRHRVPLSNREWVFYQISGRSEQPKSVRKGRRLSRPVIIGQVLQHLLTGSLGFSKSVNGEPPTLIAGLFIG